MADQRKINKLVKEAVESYKEKTKDFPPDYTLSGMAQACLGCNYRLRPDCPSSTGKTVLSCRSRNMMLDMVKKSMASAGG